MAKPEDTPGKGPKEQRVDVYHHYPEGGQAQLNRIESKMNTLLGIEVAQMAQIEDLQAEVNENTDVTQSAITLMNGLSQQLKDALASNDPAAVQAVIDQLDQNTNSLAAAVTANTPAQG